VSENAGKYGVWVIEHGVEASKIILGLATNFEPILLVFSIISDFL
jgi:hypothetical protein